MQEITIYEKCRGNKCWFDFDNRCGDWVECTDSVQAQIPDGYHFSQTVCDVPGIWRDGESQPTALDLDTDKHGVFFWDFRTKVYIYRFGGENRAGA